MFPEICKIGPFTIYSYGLMLVAAFSVGTFFAAREAKRQGISPELIFNLTFIVFISGIIGSRLFFVVENLDTYIKKPLEIIMLQHGGLSWFGGLILGSTSGIVYLRIKKAPVLKTLDILAPYIALAQAVGRVGCFLNGCCGGTIFNRIPVQLVSSFLLLVIFIVLRFMLRRPHLIGQIILAYLLFYSVKRFSIEFFRTDNPIIWANLTLFQILSAVLFLFSAVSLTLLKLRKK
ncbi:MAG: prolipoprotein diacylglyceryl transferase [Candidatus Omnitrophica bacterium]|nr:prolipoprotein diacylglyceryl transferase [Candidatus Omnitrophota bacterium]